MRKIEFRGFSVSKKQWVYGFYNYTFEVNYFSQSHDDVPPRCHYIFTETAYFEVYPRTVGQYTGLKDKNGTKIYDGDIVKCIEVTNDRVREYESVVYWEDGCYLVHESDMCDVPLEVFYEGIEKYPLTEIEVIGHICDNPELLEVK